MTSERLAAEKAIEAIDHPCHEVCVGNLHADCQCAAWIRQEALSVVRSAQFVAEYWLDAYMENVRRGESQYAIGTHPLALVLAALDGETDPVKLGLSDDVHGAFAARLQSTPTPRDSA